MYKEEFAVELPEVGSHAADNLERAEAGKKRLSKVTECTIRPIMGEEGSVKVPVTREQFEQAIAAHISKTEMLVETVLDEANLETSDIDQVLLVGGSCRIPHIQQRVEAMFGFPPIFSGSLVDECVALGAAIYSGLISLREDPSSVAPGIRRKLGNTKVQDVCQHSYGTIALFPDEETGRDVEKNSIVLKRNTPIPTSESRTYYTAVDGQQSIPITITQGEGEDKDFVETLYEGKLAGLPPGRPANRPIEVTYSYDENQRMHCAFKDVESGVIREVDLTQGTGGISAKE